MYNLLSKWFKNQPQVESEAPTRQLQVVYSNDVQKFNDKPQLCYRLVIPERVSDICAWQGYIVTVSCTSKEILKVWEDDGKRATSVVFKTVNEYDEVIYVKAWGNILVTASTCHFKYWTLKKQNDELKLECTAKFKTNPVIQSIEIWNDMLYSNEEDFTHQRSVSVWDKKAKLLQRIVNPVEFSRMLAFQNVLWTSGTYIRIFKQGHNFVLTHHKTLCPGYFSYLCAWGENRVAVSSDEDVLVFDAEGNLLFKLEMDYVPDVLVQWKTRLVVCEHPETLATNSHITIFNWDGSVFRNIMKGYRASGNGTHLWLATKSGVCVMWDRDCYWSVIRLLWIGWKKNEAKNCYLACLPKEIVFLIASYLCIP